MRVDEKEEWLYQLCKKYRLFLDYSWGVYYIGFRVEVHGNMDSHLDIVMIRSDLETFSLEKIEEIVLEYVFQNGW